MEDNDAMNLHAIEAFLAIVDEGSFAAAARKLQLSRSAVTERVATLEADVGGQLLERHPVTMTALGATFEPFARRVITELSAAKAAIADLATRTQSQLRIGMLGGGAVEMNVPLFRTLRWALPQARIRLTELPLAEMESAVVNGHVDAAILRSPVGDPRLRAVPLFWAPRVAVVASDSELASAESLTVSDLADVTFTGVSRRNSRRFQDFFLLTGERNGELPKRMLPAYTLSDSGLHVLAHGAVATPTAEVLRVFPMAGVRTVPLLDAPPSAAVAVCREDDVRHGVRVFMEAAVQVAISCKGLVPDAISAPTA